LLPSGLRGWREAGSQRKTCKANVRARCVPVSGFRGRPTRPLSHLSGSGPCGAGAGGCRLVVAGRGVELLLNDAGV